jgi:hypothetical protein
MRRLAARKMSVVPGLVASRARRILLAAGACVFGSLLALGAPAPAPEDVVLELSVPAGKETVVSKEAKTGGPASASIAEGFEPTTVGRLVTMALVPALPQTGPLADAEPNLRGLSEIPRELIWNRPPAEDDKKKRKASAAFSRVSENLPWDAVEPVHFTPLGPRATPGKVTPQPKGATPPTPQTVVALPRGGEVKRWIKSKVTEIKGSSRARPLYHFELWLEPPTDVKQRLVGVSYAFSSPAIRPQTQTSSDRTNGFRISAGGLACADEVTLTLRFDDGRSHTVALDGCKLLG